MLFPECFYTPRLCLGCWEQLILIPRCPQIPPCSARQTIHQHSGLHLPPAHSQGTNWVEKAAERIILQTWWLCGRAFVFLEGICSQIMFVRPNRQGIDELLGKPNIWCLLCSIHPVISHLAIKARENVAQLLKTRRLRRSITALI